MVVVLRALVVPTMEAMAKGDACISKSGSIYNDASMVHEGRSHSLSIVYDLPKSSFCTIEQH